MQDEELHEVMAGGTAIPEGREASSYSEAMSLLKRAIADSDVTLSQLPSFNKVKEKWSQLGVPADDISWVLVDAMMVKDQRDHLRALAVTKVCAAHSEAMVHTVDEIRHVIERAHDLEISTAKAAAEIAAYQNKMTTFGGMLKTLIDSLSPLIEYIHRAMRILEDRTVKAAILQAGIALASSGVGAVIVWIIMRR